MDWVPTAVELSSNGGGTGDMKREGTAGVSSQFYLVKLQEFI